MHDVMQLYQKYIGMLSGSQREKLYQVYDEGMSPFVIGCAILRAGQERRRMNNQGQQKRISFNYLWGIIQDWLIHGITDEESFKAYWQFRQEKYGMDGGQNVKAKGKSSVFGRDYQYNKRKPAAKGYFTFLDD